MRESPPGDPSQRRGSSFITLGADRLRRERAREEEMSRARSKEEHSGDEEEGEEENLDSQEWLEELEELHNQLIHVDHELYEISEHFLGMEHKGKRRHVRAANDILAEKAALSVQRYELSVRFYELAGMSEELSGTQGDEKQRAEIITRIREQIEAREQEGRPHDDEPHPTPDLADPRTQTEAERARAGAQSQAGHDAAALVETQRRLQEIEHARATDAARFAEHVADLHRHMRHRDTERDRRMFEQERIRRQQDAEVAARQARLEAQNQTLEQILAHLRDLLARSGTAHAGQARDAHATDEPVIDTDVEEVRGTEDAPHDTQPAADGYRLATPEPSASHATPHVRESDAGEQGSQSSVASSAAIDADLETLQASVRDLESRLGVAQQEALSAHGEAERLRGLAAHFEAESTERKTQYRTELKTAEERENKAFLAKNAIATELTAAVSEAEQLKRENQELKLENERLKRSGVVRNEDPIVRERALFLTPQGNTKLAERITSREQHMYLTLKKYWEELERNTYLNPFKRDEVERQNLGSAVRRDIELEDFGLQVVRVTGMEGQMLTARELQALNPVFDRVIANACAHALLEVAQASDEPLEGLDAKTLADLLFGAFSVPEPRIGFPLVHIQQERDEERYFINEYINIRLFGHASAFDEDRNPMSPSNHAGHLAALPSVLAALSEKVKRDKTTKGLTKPLRTLAERSFSGFRKRT